MSSSSSDESDSSLEKQNGQSKKDSSISLGTRDKGSLGSYGSAASKCTSSIKLHCSSSTKQRYSAEHPCDPDAKQSIVSVKPKYTSQSPAEPPVTLVGQKAYHWDYEPLFDGPRRKPRLPKLTQHIILAINSGSALSEDATEGNKCKESRRGAKLDFTRFMFQKVVIKLNGRRQFTGQMQGCDEYNNIVITEGREKINGRIHKIDNALVRGNSIRGIESCAEPL
ncbi:unnamed protein product [Meganyctiphanes norvegica]|uniref:Sm domain-containing protein n=1 Tax=Meganyctiphanes norvegica TaxID=48144 RepID=A0AAV2QDI2_MEGNR